MTIMKRKLLVSTFVILLLYFLAVPIIKFGKANFIPYPEEPTTPTISIQSPKEGDAYIEKHISIVFDVEEPESWYTGLTNPTSWGKINWITYALDNSERVNVTENRIPNESNSLFTVHYEKVISGLSEGNHILNVSISSSCYHKPSSEGMVGEPHYSTVVESYVVSFTVDATNEPNINRTDINSSNIFGATVIFSLASIIIIVAFILTRYKKLKQ